uniref:SEL1 protein n=1 Tax=Tetraselmis sp. GSL018 TaxID=582737 RepID=A0A061QSM2_9CHLO
MRFAALGVFALLLSVQSSASTSEHQPDELSDEAESIYRDVLAKRSAGLVDGGWIHQRLLHAAKAKLDPRNGAVHVADRGSHPGALFELYSMYEAGRNATRDRRLAAALLSAAAERGWPPAQAETGFRHAMGLHNASDVTARGIAEISKPDTPRALLNYYFAARQNSSFANTVMGYRHSVGLGVPKSCAAAVLYYNSAAEDVISSAREHSGFPQAERLRLSHKAISGLHRRREHDVLQYYLYSADLGDVEAQSAVGHILNHGAHGLERNHVQARRYFLRAAEQGDVKAMSHLGHMYANGLGVSRDNATALKWFNKAAARNHPSALYGLGYLHLAGYGVKKDDAKAFNYFTLAAEQNHPESQFHLGVMHLKGWGVKQDRQRAFHYFQLAASTGHALAQYNVAMMQLATDPSRSSCERALSMLKLVAERGPPAEALQAARSHFVAGRASMPMRC